MHKHPKNHHCTVQHGMKSPASPAPPVLSPFLQGAEGQSLLLSSYTLLWLLIDQPLPALLTRHRSYSRRRQKPGKKDLG